MSNRLPRLDVKALFGKLGRDDGSPRKLTTSKRLDGFLRCIRVLVFDVDFPNAEVDARACRTGNLDFDNLTVFGTFFFNVFFDFCNRWISARFKSDNVGQRALP